MARDEMARTMAPTWADEATPADDDALAMRGDVPGFVKLYHIHVRAVHAYLLARLGNVQDAEDVTVEVFERAWTSLPRYKPRGTFKAWLFTIAHHAMADHYRRWGGERARTVSLEGLDEILADPAGNPEGGVLASEAVRQVLIVMGALPRDQQEVIGLRFLGEFQYAEIARILGKRESAVKMSAYRALQEIRRRCGHDARSDG